MPTRRRGGRDSRFIKRGNTRLLPKPFCAYRARPLRAICAIRDITGRAKVIRNWDKKQKHNSGLNAPQKGFPPLIIQRARMRSWAKQQMLISKCPNPANTYRLVNPIRLRRISQKEIYWRLSGCIEMPSANTIARGEVSGAICLPWMI